MTDGQKGVGLQLPHISQTRAVKFSWCLHRLNALIKKKKFSNSQTKSGLGKQMQSGLTAGFAGAGSGSGSGTGAGAGLFSASAGFAFQLLTRPATPPLMPATSWEKQRISRSSPSLSLPCAHLNGGGGAFWGAADVALFPHVLDAACASCGNIWHCRLRGFHFFVSLWTKKNNDDNFKGCWKVAVQRKTLSDRSPGRLMRTGPFCCRSWRRWGCGTIWAWCCIEEETCDISAMMHKCPVHLSKLITHLFWADLFKNSAFSPICTKKKRIRVHKSLSITCQISPGQVVPDQHPRWPHRWADQAVHKDVCLDFSELEGLAVGEPATTQTAQDELYLSRRCRAHNPRSYSKNSCAGVWRGPYLSGTRHKRPLLSSSADIL